MACVISDRGAVRNSARIWGAMVCAAKGRNKPTTTVQPSATTLQRRTVPASRRGRTFAYVYRLTADGDKRSSDAAEGIIRDYGTSKSGKIQKRPLYLIVLCFFPTAGLSKAQANCKKIAYSPFRAWNFVDCIQQKSDCKSAC